MLQAVGSFDTRKTIQGESALTRLGLHLAEKMEKYSSMVQRLVSLSVKLIAVDFDLTIINIHTHGSWQFTSKALVSRVRPTFKHFLTAALKCSDLHVAVVTQSPQVSLVREVLEKALPDCDTSVIHIRGSDGKWKELKGVSKEGEWSLQIRDCSESLNLRKRFLIIREKFKTNHRIRSLFSVI